MATLEDLHRRMEEAGAAMDFEEAARLRDQISLLRGQGEEAAGEIVTSGLDRQQPGRMGLGTSRQQVTPPEGWKAPRKPDPLTSGTSRSRRAKRD